MIRMQVRDIRETREPRALIEDLRLEGYVLGVYGCPVYPDGFYPASVEQAIDAWDADPGLVYVDVPQEISEWCVPLDDEG